jgi:hypothetical protein
MIHWKRIGKEEKFGIVNAIMGVREATLVKNGVTEKTSIVVLCDLSEEKGLEALNWTDEQVKDYLESNCNLVQIDADLQSNLESE